MSLLLLRCHDFFVSKMQYQLLINVALHLAQCTCVIKIVSYVFQWHIWHILPNCFYFNFNIKKLKILIINKSNYNFSPCFCSLFFFNYNFFIKYVPLYTLSSNKIDKILLSYQVKLKILIIIKNLIYSESW